MKQFMAVYVMPAAEMKKMMASMTPEDRKKEMDEWVAWGKKHEADLVDMGGAFGKNKSVTGAGIEDISNDLGGYAIVKAETHEDAAKIFTDMESYYKMPGAKVEVMEIMKM